MEIAHGLWNDLIAFSPASSVSNTCTPPFSQAHPHSVSKTLSWFHGWQGTWRTLQDRSCNPCWSALCFWPLLSLVRQGKLREKCSFSWCWSLICQKSKVCPRITPWEQNSTECRSPANEINAVLELFINESSCNEALAGWFVAPFVCRTTWCSRKDGLRLNGSKNRLGSFVFASQGTNFAVPQPWG